MQNFYFVLFVSSGLGMRDRLNSLACNDRLKLPVATPALRNYCERVEYSLTYLSFASFIASYV